MNLTVACWQRHGIEALVRTTTSEVAASRASIISVVRRGNDLRAYVGD